MHTYTERGDRFHYSVIFTKSQMIVDFGSLWFWNNMAYIFFFLSAKANLITRFVWILNIQLNNILIHFTRQVTVSHLALCTIQVVSKQL